MRASMASLARCCGESSSTATNFHLGDGRMASAALNVRRSITPSPDHWSFPPTKSGAGISPSCHWCAGASMLSLYVVLDLFSRFVVAWMLSRKENSALSTQLMGEALGRYDIVPGQLTRHQDCGSPMIAHGYIWSA